MKKIGIIISMFPEIHETFIVRELAELERQGLPFEIYSLQKPRDPITLEEAKKLMDERTHYAPLFGWAQWRALIKGFISNPLTFIKLIAEIIWFGKDRPMEILKSFAIFPLTFYFGEQIKKEGINHLHGHWANVPTTACWILGRMQKKSWSAAIHGEDIFTPNKLLEHKLKQSTFTVVCTGYFCQHLQRNMNHTHPKDIYLNYHGLSPKICDRVEARKAMPAKRDNRTEPFSILTIGRLVPTKGHDLLITAVSELVKQGRKVELKIVGSGPEETNLKEHITQIERQFSLSLKDNIRFLGMLSFSEVMEQFEQVDCFALACRMISGQPPDGIPNVIAEAMAMGIPVISTNMGAIPELVEHEKTGLLAEPNDVTSLITQLTKLMDDTALKNKMIIDARSKVLASFDQKKNVGDLIKIFERYLS